MLLLTLGRRCHDRTYVYGDQLGSYFNPLTFIEIDEMGRERFGAHSRKAVLPKTTFQWKRELSLCVLDESGTSLDSFSPQYKSPPEREMHDERQERMSVHSPPGCAEQTEKSRSYSEKLCPACINCMPRLYVTSLGSKNISLIAN